MESTNNEKPKQSGWVGKLETPKMRQITELSLAIIMSLTTFFSAWCAFESRLWSGVQSMATNSAGAKRALSGQATNRALTKTTVDVLLFTEYAAAVSEDNQALAEFLSDRFRPEFKIAFDAWLATKPLENPDAPPSPFAMEEYILEDQVQSDDYLEEADKKAREAAIANSIGSQYVLYTVLFAMVLFLGNISIRLTYTRIRLGVFAISILVFIIAISFLISTPHIFSIN